MPTRLLREGLLTSDRVAALSAEGERFYVRLILIVDDYGLHDARIAVLKAKMFPLLDTCSVEEVARWLHEVESVRLVSRYEVAGKPYLHLLNFQQRLRRLAPKCPLPPGMDERSLPFEENVREELAAAIESAGVFCGHKVVSVEQEVRLEASYMDIFVVCEKARFVLELKRTKLTDKALQQVVDYAERSDASPILIGAGITPSMEMDDAKKRNCAVVIFDEQFNFTLELQSRDVKSFAVVLDRAKSQELARRKAPLETETLTLTDTEAKTDTEAEGRGAQSALLDALPAWLPKAEWDRFVAKRKEIRKPLTGKAAKDLLSRLNRFREQGFDLAAIIRDSYENGWAGLFAKKEHKLKPAPGQRSAKSQEAVRAFAGRGSR